MKPLCLSVDGQQERAAFIQAQCCPRDPVLPEAEMQELIGFLGDLGYDTARVRRMPQPGSSRASNRGGNTP